MKNKNLLVLVLLAILAMSSLSACNNKAAENGWVWYNPFSYGDQTLSTTRAEKCVSGAETFSVDGVTFPCEAPAGTLTDAEANIIEARVQKCTNGAISFVLDGVTYPCETPVNVVELTPASETAKPAAETPKVIEPAAPVFVGDPFKACPEGANVGADGKGPYGDYQNTGVVCEYEVVGSLGGTIVDVPSGMSALVADWAPTCPTGTLCEGTWVATKSFTLPAGWNGHVYLYAGLDSAAARFLGNQSTGAGSFACEYVKNHSGHTVDNIRTPNFWSTWTEGTGSIAGHAKICQ